MLIIILFFILLALAYSYGTRGYDYWAKRGVTHEKPIPFFGNGFKQFVKRQSRTQAALEAYRKYPNERFVGSFYGTEKTLTIRDPELVKAILVTDSKYFHKRELNSHETAIKPMLKNLFFANGDVSRLLRPRRKPAPIMGLKQRVMFPSIAERAVKVQELADKAAKTGATVDVKDLMARYTTDLIGVCGFGVDTAVLDDENSAFRKLVRSVFTLSYRDAFVIMLKKVLPEMFKNFNFLALEIEKNTLHLVQEVIKERNSKSAGKYHFIDLLLDYKKTNKLTVEMEQDDTLIAAQAFLFFAAGIETSSSATSYTLHELAFHPEEQKKVQDEIDKVLSKYDNKLCYYAIKEMKYLHMAFGESMRLFPPLGFLIRKCVKNYTLPGTNVTIDKGVTVIIPLQALHTDEKYFEQPEKFIPERFSPERLNDTHRYACLPFGEGPLACIDQNVVVLQSLAGLAVLLHKFSVEPAPTSVRNPISDPSATITQSIKGGIPLLIKARTEETKGVSISLNFNLLNKIVINR